MPPHIQPERVATTDSAIEDAPTSGFIQSALVQLGPDLTLFVLSGLVLLVVGQLYGAHYVLRLSTILLPGCIAPGILVLRAAQRFGPLADDAPGARRAFAVLARSTLRDWIPLVLVALVFDNLQNYTGLVRDQPIDAALHRMDLALFGVEPTVWIRRFYNPLLTDWMATCYGSFLIVPMFLAITLSLRGRRDDFRELALAVMLQMWIAFFLFVCLPAGPPRYFAELRNGPFQLPLPSLLGFNDRLQGTWDTYNPNLVRASFPSLHCAYATTTLIYAWRFGSGVFARPRRLFFFLVLPVELTLIVSTVYLRHHWIPDIAAGIGLSVGVCTMAPWLRRRWPSRALVH